MYRSNMVLMDLNLLNCKNIMVYAFPVHTSVKTKQCDSVIFSSFNNDLKCLFKRYGVQTIGGIDGTVLLDEFDYCSMIRKKYYDFFPRTNIQSRFRRSDIYLFDSKNNRKFLEFC